MKGRWRGRPSKRGNCSRSTRAACGCRSAGDVRAIVNGGTKEITFLKVYHKFFVAPLRLDLLPLALLAQVIMFDDRPLPEAA